VSTTAWETTGSGLVEQKPKALSTLEVIVSKVEVEELAVELTTESLQTAVIDSEPEPELDKVLEESSFILLKNLLLASLRAFI
jgi:pheromone shutdown protein TraB